MKVTALAAAVALAVSGLLAGCGQEGSGGGASGGSSATSGSGSSGSGSMGRTPGGSAGSQPDQSKRSTSPSGSK